MDEPSVVNGMGARSTELRLPSHNACVPKGLAAASRQNNLLWTFRLEPGSFTRTKAALRRPSEKYKAF